MKLVQNGVNLNGQNALPEAGRADGDPGAGPDSRPDQAPAK